MDLIFLGKSPGRVKEQRNFPVVRQFLDLIDQIKALGVGKIISDDQKIESQFLKFSQCFGAGSDGNDIQFLTGDQIGDLRSPRLIGFSNQNVLHARLNCRRDAIERLLKNLSRLYRLGQSAHRAHPQATFALFLGCDDLHGNMARGRIILQTVEHAPAIDIRKINIQRDGRWIQLTGKHDRL